MSNIINSISSHRKKLALGAGLAIVAILIIKLISSETPVSIRTPTSTSIPVMLNPTSTSIPSPVVLNATSTSIPRSTVVDTTPPGRTAAPIQTPTPSPTNMPDPEIVISLIDAFNQELIQGEFRGKGKVGDESIVLTLRRGVLGKFTISVPPGILLLNKLREESDVVVRQLKGTVGTGNTVQPLDTIELTDSEWHEYLLEVYTLDFDKDPPSSNASFQLSGLTSPDIVAAIEGSLNLPEIHSDAIQVAIWAISNGIDKQAVMDSGYLLDIEAVRLVFEEAGLIPDQKRLFDESVIQTAEGYVTRGNSYFEIGEYVQAIADYTEAVNLQPEYIDARYRRGFAHAQLLAFDEAIDDFSDVIRLDGQNPLGYFARGVAYNARPEPDYDLAIEDLTTAIRLKPDVADFYHARGLVHSSRQDFNQAINDFTSAIELNPDFVDAFYARGAASASLQDFPPAIEDFTEAIGLNPLFADAFLARGLAYRSHGQNILALQDFQHYLDLNPEAANRQDTEDMIATIQEELANPVSDQVISLFDGINQGLIEFEIRGLGVATGDSILLEIRRTVDQELEISIPLGATLISNIPNEQNMVIRRLRGLLVSDTSFQPTATIHLIDDNPQSYFIEAYSLDFGEAIPSRTTTFSISESENQEVLQVLEGVDSLSEITNDILAIQAAIWVITDDVAWSDLAGIHMEPNLEMVRDILLAAKIDPASTTLFEAN